MKLKQMQAAIAGAFALGALPSSFDVTSFGAGSFEGKGDTRRLQIDAKEYTGVIKGPFGEDKSTRLRPTDKGQLIFNVVYQLDDPEQCAKLGIEKLPQISQSIFLDLTPQGGLDMGPFKNAQLNLLRAACGLNEDGVKWGFADFVGRPVKVKVEHKANKDDPANPYQNVTAVTKM